MTGTASQIEWAERIKATVIVEFDRVATLFSAVKEGQSDAVRAGSLAIVAILEEKRSEVMSRQDAGYFIRDWQEITDQVRRMILRDRRYEAIRAGEYSNIKVTL